MLSISRNNKNDQAFCYPLLEISYSKLGDSAVLFIVLLMKLALFLNKIELQVTIQHRISNGPP